MLHQTIARTAVRRWMEVKMGKVKNLEFIINHCEAGATLGYKFAYGNEMYGDYISIDALDISPRELIRAINLLIGQIEGAVDALENKEATNG